MDFPLTVLELFCGIGGCAAALGDRANVVAAVDIDREALAIYRMNFPHRTENLTIESIPPSAFREWDGALWWLSPPCQPFTYRGRRRDLDDPRAASFRVVLKRIEEIGPRCVALENVAGFFGSSAHALLLETLDRRGYRVGERILCPTEIGAMNRRPRFYLIASQDQLASWPTWRVEQRPIADLLDPCPAPETFLPPSTVIEYATALNVVRADDPKAVASCFTSAYGRSAVRAGSYLYADGTLRRFTPGEILRLLGFPQSFRVPADLPLRRGWALAGNSLSVHAVRWVLATISELRTSDT